MPTCRRWRALYTPNHAGLVRVLPAQRLAAAILAAWGTWQAWAWYNGAISYVLMGALLAGEWLIRPRAALRGPQ